LQKKTILPLAFLCGVPFVMVLGNSMLIPVLPQMKDALQISQVKVSLVITLFSIPAGLAIPAAGLLSDRINRKTIIAVSLLLYALGGVIAGGAAIFIKQAAYPLIMAGRVLQGMGAAGTAPIAMALAGDIFTSHERSKVLGLLEASNGLGKVISPILGSLLGLIAWWAVFFLFPLLCVPIALGIWFIVKEPKERKNKPQAFREYVKDLKTIFKNKGVSLLTAFFAGNTVLFILFGVLFYLSDHLETKYKIEGVLKGAIIAIPVLAMASTSYLTGYLTQKKSAMLKVLVVAGTAVLAAATAVVPFFRDNTYIMVLALVFAGVGTGMVLPCLNTLITGSCNIDERGMVTALYGGVRFFGVALGPPLFGLLMDKSELWTFLFPAILAALASLFSLVLLKQQVLREKVSPNQKPAQGRESREEKKVSQGLLRKVLLTAKIKKQPLLRPEIREKVRERVAQRVLEELAPQVDGILQKELLKESKVIREQVIKELHSQIRSAVQIQVREDDDSQERPQEEQDGRNY